MFQNYTIPGQPGIGGSPGAPGIPGQPGICCENGSCRICGDQGWFEPLEAYCLTNPYDIDCISLARHQGFANRKKKSKTPRAGSSPDAWVDPHTGRIVAVPKKLTLGEQIRLHVK